MSESTGHRMFGLPQTMSERDAESVVQYLSRVWVDTYRTAPTPSPYSDLELCRDFFDPLLRGRTLRDKLAGLPEEQAPPPAFGGFVLEYPVVVAIDKRHWIVGVEGRLVIALLTSAEHISGQVVVDETELFRALATALDVYRHWSTERMRQVLALRQGRGSEVLQAKAAGLVLALLVNRSTDSSRAVSPDDPASGAACEKALFGAAEAFAARVAERSERSMAEDRFKGGYAVTEARRRLWDFHIDRDSRKWSFYYLAPDSENRVTDQIAYELARRPKLTRQAMVGAFDDLVEVYREQARLNAWRGGFYERSADTAALRERLTRAFESHRRAAESL